MIVAMKDIVKTLAIVSIDEVKLTMLNTVLLIDFTLFSGGCCERLIRCFPKNKGKIKYHPNTRAGLCQNKYQASNAMLSQTPTREVT